MAYQNVTTSPVVLGRIENQFIGGVTPDQFRASLQSLNVNDPISCQQTVKRCNDRCRDNKVDATVKVAALAAGGGDPTPGSIAESFSVSFQISK